MTRARSVRPASSSRALVLIAGLALGCGDDGSTATETSTATSTMTSGMTDAPTTADTPTTTSDTGDGGGFCAHQCTVDADCIAGGQDLGLTCQDNVCTGDSASCTGDPECVAVLSGWSTPCTSGGGECDALAQLCVQVEGGGACATPPSDFFICDTVPGWADLEVPDIDGNPVTVCGNPTAECNDDGFCFSPCQSDADCASAAYPICDTGTGFCGCGSDADCANLGAPHLSICSAGTCGCGADQQCVDGDAGDTCTADGFCGCSGDAACADVENFFDGGVIACVAP